MAQAPEIKQFIGALNLDDSLEVIGKGNHNSARNIVFTGTPPNRRVNVMAGNILVNNSLLPATGVNKTIGEKYDPINKRIYFFNYNSLGKNGIYIFNTIPKTFQRLVEVGVNTIDDPLAFNAEIIYNIDVIYGDSQQGDILYYIDTLFRPSKININTALSGGYGSIQRSFLDVAKEPADIPPYVVYEDDSANTINNLRKQLFRFKIRWVFDDLDKSVTSSQSVMPLPYNAFDQTISTDPTKNCRIAITYQTGASNVKKIEIFAANSLGNQMSDFYLIASIDKLQDNVGNNDIASYLFYNDKAYTSLSTTESDQLFDYVPQAAIAQGLLNGNVVTYGNITEGYPNLMDFSNGTSTSFISSGNAIYYTGIYYTNLIATQNGASGFGIGVVHIIIRGVGVPANYVIYFTDGSTVEYNSSIATDPATILNGLRSDAISKGFTIVTIGDNSLKIFKNGLSLARTNIITDYAFNSTLNMSFNAYDWSSKQGFGQVYFDEKGRTNGVVYTQGYSIQTYPYSEDHAPSDIPRIATFVYHQPPEWAYYFQWVRTKNLSKQRFIQWITDRTFKDTIAVTGLIKYAYLSIESLNEFVRNNSGSPLVYGFTAGDRVRFFKRYTGDGGSANVYANAKDYEVVGSLLNPSINGEVKTGQFVKIILPNTDGSFDFGTSGFDNYFIEIYTPAQPLSNNLNLYYEFGERYAIGDPGLATRFHQGMLQNQIYASGTTADYEWTKGDFYARKRAIQTGNVYRYSILNGGTGGSIDTILIGMTFNGSTYVDPNITPQSVPYVPLTGSFNPSGDSRHFIAANTITTFKIEGTVTLTFTDASAGDSWRIYLVNKFNENLILVDSFDASEASTHSFTLSSATTFENDWGFLIAASVVSRARNVTFSSSNINFTQDHVINQVCIDPNFSDYFPSIVNSNGRAWVYEENANTITYPTMYRWGLAYQQDTEINQTNRFYPENFDTVDRSKGAIMKFGIWDRVLTIFQERKCGQTGIYQKYVTDGGSQSQLLTTDSIITSNNVQYYAGDFGCGNQPQSIIQSGFVYYFVDPIKAKICRLSRDGITDLSETYKVQTWASANLPKYLNPGLYRFGGNQRVLGTFNIRPDNVSEYLLLAQGTSTVAGETFSFEERYNGFPSHYDIDCDSIVCAENVLFAFRNGQLYQQSTANAYSVFFDQQYAASISIPFTDKEAIKKLFMALGYQSNRTWTAQTTGDVYTNTVNSQTFLQQQSLLMDQDFDILENPSRYAAFNRDQNSMSNTTLALWEGDYLTGNYIVVKLSITINGPTYLYAPYVTWRADPRNF